MDKFLNLLKSFAQMRNLMSFYLTLFSLIGCFALAFSRGVDIMNTVPVLLGIFVTAHTAERVNAVRSAMNDTDCDTHQVINELEGRQPPTPPAP